MVRRKLQLKGLDPVFFVSHILLLIISYSIYLAPHIAPSTFPYFGLVPIVYPLLVIINLAVVTILLFRRQTYGVLFLILTLGLFPPLIKTYQFFGKKIVTQPDLKVLSYNAHYFREDGFIEFFNKENADVVLLQEVYSRNSRFKLIKDSAFQNYYHEKNAIVHVFSKYPIIEFKKILSGEDGSTGYAAYADIDTGSDTIRFINVYLESMLLDKELVKQSIDVDHAEENSKVISSKLASGFLMHEKQIKQLLPIIWNSKHPIIFAGDLNSVPNSYEYQQITYWLKDAYFEVGKSSGTTFDDFKYPVRLDYIFHTKDLLATKLEVVQNVKLSDHSPVIGYFKLP